MFEPKTAKPVDQNDRSDGRYVRERSESGEMITVEVALTVSAVLAAFTILSEDLSSIPLILYQRKAKGKDRAWGSPYYRLMHDRPNAEHTSMIFRELMEGHLLGWGNFYGQLCWNSAGDVTDIWPLRPDRMFVERLNGQRIYRYSTADGKLRNFLSDSILHIPAFGFNGLTGLSRIAMARNSIGLAKSAEKFGSKFYENDARPGVAYKTDKKLSETAYNHLQESLVDDHAGADNSHKPMILEEGLTIQEIGIPPEDAQYLETRRFQVSEIARIFRVPPHMIGDVSGSTSWGSGIDSMEQGYVNHTLRPWAIRIEQCLDQQLLLEKDRGTQYFEHLFDALLRGDIATRYAAYASAIGSGWMNPNEARTRENMNPYDGGDEFTRPLNMRSATTPAPSPTQAAALEPLFDEATERVIRREMNDLRGAVRRRLAKDQPDAFWAWVDKFYSDEQPEFIKKAFGPVLAAQTRLFGLDAGELLDGYFENYISARRESLCLKTADELTQEIDLWSEDLPREMCAEISRLVRRLE